MAEDDCTGGVSSLYLIYKKKKEKGFLSGYNCVSEMGILCFFHFAGVCLKNYFRNFAESIFQTYSGRGKREE